uniref:Uncharacterized protein n=1 Tax=Chrysotila carterae TaxID=13221 RepID=A0A7S4BFN8_CHRCT|eukprot:5501498-Pleurochrysis_carterae.AAC.2
MLPSQLLEYINRNRTALGGIHFPLEEDGERFSVGCSAARGSRAHAPESSTLLIGNKELLSAIRLVPGLEKLVRSVRTGAQSGLELLHAWVLSEVGDAVCHALRHDRLEEFDETGARDRVCERTVVVDLKGEGRAALQVVGCAPTRFARAPGAALAFDSSLWYRMCRPISAGDEVIKLILVFGALL